MARALQFFKVCALTARDKVVVGTQKRYALWWPYLRVELRPPTAADLPEIQKGIKGLVSGAANLSFKNLTVKETFQNFLVCFEIYCWFLLGECIGRGAVPGYILNIGPAYGTNFRNYSVVYSKKPFDKKRDYSDVE